MKIALLIGEGANQKALACRIHAKYPISKIVVESNKYKRKITFKKILLKVLDKIFTSKIDLVWNKLQNYYNSIYINFPIVPKVKTNQINSSEIIKLLNSDLPDLIIVSGTSMIKENILSLPIKYGIINLHTGLSPYVKGGPNCTNWCIATNQIHLIGNTVMWIDSGIDSGNIIATEVTHFSGEENLYEIHFKVMNHAHDLYIRCIESVIQGRANKVPQETLGKGKTYYTKNWTFKQRLNLIRNLKGFKSAVQSANASENKQQFKTVKIE